MSSLSVAATTGIVAGAILKGGFQDEGPLAGIAEGDLAASTGLTQKMLWHGGVTAPNAFADTELHAWRSVLVTPDAEIEPRGEVEARLRSLLKVAQLKVSQSVVTAATDIGREELSGWLCFREYHHRCKALVIGHFSEAVEAAKILGIGGLTAAAIEALPYGTHTSAAVDEWDAELARLWQAARGAIDLDDDEIAPGETTVTAIERLIPSIRQYRLPLFGLNDDGSVALRWVDRTRPRSFALHFGPARVSAVFSEPLDGPGFAQSFALSDVERVLPFMKRLSIADLVEG